MATPIIMPQLGETVAEGKILTWFVKVGDVIGQGDRLFEVETDKVTVEVEATVAGALSEIRVGDGGVAKVGAVVAVIGGEAVQPQAAAAPAAAPQSSSSQSSPSQSSPSQSAPSAPVARSPFEEVATPLENHGPATAPNGLKVTPLARRLIARHGLDVAALAASVAARGGKRIAEADVQQAIGAAQAAAPAPGTRAPAASAPAALQLEGASIPLSGIRQKTAARLAENWRSIPHVFQAVEADFTAVEAVRSRHRQAFRAAHGTSLTYLPFIARATCLALAAFPLINARFDGTALFPSAEINLGIAVDLNHQGLVVPVVRNAGDLTVEGLAKAIGRMVEKARAGKLTADDLSGGTYSITNNGAFGTLFTSPIINAPQVAILSVDAIALRPMVVATDQGSFIAPRLAGMLGQSFDHRAFDGAYAAAFLSRLKTILETRDWASEFATSAFATSAFATSA